MVLTMGFLSSIAGSFSNILNSAVDTGLSYLGNSQLAKEQYNYNKHLQQHNINWEREQAQNRIQWAAADAAKAGIHPLAAIGSAGNISSAPASTSPGGSVQTNFASNALQARAQRLQEMSTKSGIAVNESQSAKNVSEAALNKALSIQALKSAGLSSKQIDIMARTGTYPGMPTEGFNFLGFGRTRPAGSVQSVSMDGQNPRDFRNMSWLLNF